MISWRDSPQFCDQGQARSMVLRDSIHYRPRQETHTKVSRTFCGTKILNVCLRYLFYTALCYTTWLQFPRQHSFMHSYTLMLPTFIKSKYHPTFMPKIAKICKNLQKFQNSFSYHPLTRLRLSSAVGNGGMAR